MGNIYRVNDILVGALSDRPAPSSNILLFIDEATGKGALSDGTAWNDFGSFPGVMSDGANGIEVAGEFKSIGDGGFVAIVRVNNALTVRDESNNVLAYIDSTGAVYATNVQAASLGLVGTVDRIAQCVIQLQPNQTDEPLLITDSTGQVFEVWVDSSAVLHARHGFSSFAGGIGVFGHAMPNAQPTMTLVTSTITDANAKATIKALIGIINGCGLAAITES